MSKLPTQPTRTAPGLKARCIETCARLRDWPREAVVDLDANA